MPLERLRRVSGVWNWLPAFRAVAEYESIQRAALALHQSPAALSRTLKLLEGRLARPLFRRSPAGMALTEDGARLLQLTRDAMRLVDEALPRLEGLRVGVCGAGLRALVSQVLAGLQGSWSRFTDLEDGQTEQQLNTGELDVVLAHRAPSERLVEATLLGEFEVGCRPGCGPLVALDHPVLGHSLAGARASSVEGVLALAASVGGRAVLPRLFVPESGGSGFEVFARVPVFACRRRSVSGEPPEGLAALLEAVVRRLQPFSDAARR